MKLHFIMETKNLVNLILTHEAMYLWLLSFKIDVSFPFLTSEFSVNTKKYFCNFPCKITNTQEEKTAANFLIT